MEFAIILQTLRDYANKALTVPEVERRLKARLLADPHAGGKALAPQVCRGILEEGKDSANARYHQSLDAMQRSIQRYPKEWRKHYEVQLYRLAIEDPDSWWLDTLIFYAIYGILASRLDFLMEVAAALPREEALARRAVEEAVGHLKAEPDTAID